MAKGRIITQTGTILFLDDDDDFRQSLTKLLEYKKYKVLEASTIEEAEQILENNWIHMATIDLSMTGDPEDRHGMFIINNDKYTSIPKVILTGHGYDPDLIRDTFKEGLVVDFIDKHDKDHELRLIDAFVDNVHINWDLQIQWDSFRLRSLISLAGYLVPLEDRIHLLHRVDELEDLLRQLFLESQQITIGRLLVFTGGVAWFEVFAVDANEQVTESVVACGQKRQVDTQIDQYKSYVPQSNAIGNIRLADTAETLRFSAIVFECIGGNLADMSTLEAIYPHRPQQEVIRILNQLLETSLAPWHTEKSSIKTITNLTQLYKTWTNEASNRLEPDDWVVKFESLCRELSKLNGLSRIDYASEELTLHISDNFRHSYPNPLRLFFDEGISLNMTMEHGTVHGHLHLNDILVDIQRYTIWMLDLSKVRQGPIILDFVVLEITLKSELLNMVDMETWCQIEQELLGANSLEETVVWDSESLEVQKILSMIDTIRKRAATVNREGIKEYIAGLFVHSLHQLATYNEENLHSVRELSFYLPHLLTTTLASPQLLPPREFVVDSENKVVTVEGKLIDKLPSLGWKILQYLYGRAGQLCSYEEILREVWQDDENDINNGAWMLNSGRPKVNARVVDLRKRLEPVPKQPKYILLVHDQGYKLEL